MSDWRAHILDKVGVGAASLAVVDDPDALLLDEGIQAAVRQEGYGFIDYRDPIAFRLTYESKYRDGIDGRSAAPLVIRAPESGAKDVPYDVLRDAHYTRLSVDELFPSLHYGTVAALGSEWLDALWQADRSPIRPRRGAQETKQFILRRLFGVDPETLQTPEDLLRILLRRHYRGQRVPRVIDDYLIAVLHSRPAFEGWPLDKIIPGRDAFFRFLQERWLLFVREELGASDREFGERVYDYLAFPGPALLPFGHDDVRVYVDDLFLEGFLRPVDPPAPIRDDHWMTVGLIIDPERDQLRRIDHLIEAVTTQLPSAEAHHRAWFDCALRWAELVALTAHVELRPEQEGGYLDAQGLVDKRFVEWVTGRYDSLHSQPALPPVMLHHVPRFLAHQRRSTGRVALLLVDGLSLDQWATMEEELKQQCDDVRFEREAVVAWLPSLTSVSRQAVFSGMVPHYFAETIDRADRDEARWQRFWQDEGIAAPGAPYVNVSGDPSDLDDVKDVMSDPRASALAIVVRKVDETAHGMRLGSEGMHAIVRRWSREGFLTRLIQHLLGENFDIFLTSDHGNIEVVGRGRPSGGMVPTERGGRVRVFDSPSALNAVAAEVPGAIAWTPSGLPDAYYTLYAPPRQAFTTAGKRVVSHGGISIEELIVPFVHIQR